MPQYLRAIKCAKWIPEQQPKWLANDDIAGDLLNDLKTSGNTLSVWRIEGGKPELQELIAAMAATRDSLAVYDYAIFESDDVGELGICAETSTGKSRGKDLNDKYHINLLELSGKKLCKLAELILKKGERKRVGEKDVAKYIASAIQGGSICLADFKPRQINLLIKLAHYLPDQEGFIEKLREFQRRQTGLLTEINGLLAQSREQRVSVEKERLRVIPAQKERSWGLP